MRLIDADALIEEFNIANNIHEGSDFWHFTGIKAFIENAPTVEAKPVTDTNVGSKWIPCSERLPEDETLLYWTTHEDGSLVLHGYNKSNGFIYNWEVDDLEKRKRQGQVIAWVPIFEPAPYNAERGGKND